MAYDPTNSYLNVAAPGVGSTGVGGLLGGLGRILQTAQNSPLWNAGLSLLAQPQYSRYPKGPFENIGTAFQQGSLMDQQRAEALFKNQYMREKIVEARQEQEGIANMQKYLAENPDALGDNPQLATIMKFFPQLGAKAYVETITNPAYQYTAALKEQELKTSKLVELAKKQELAAGDADNSLVYENAYTARDAVRYLKGLDGGESLLISPKWVSALRTAHSMGFLDPNTIGAEAAGKLARIPKDQWGPALDAAEAVEKARSNVAAMGSSQNQGVYGLQLRMTGKGAGAGAEVQDMQFRSVLDASEKMAKAVDWTLPEVDASTFSWRGGKGGIAGAGTVAPPAAPAAPADAAAAAASQSLNAPSGASSFDQTFGAASAGAPEPAPATVITPPKVKGVKTSDFGISPVTGRPAPRYTDPAVAEKAAPELKRKGIPHVIVVDPKTGIEYLYEVK